MNYSTPINTKIAVNDDQILNLLKPYDNFYFLPNRGNLGDIFIATAEYNFFKTSGKQYKILDINNIPNEDFILVYGGGGIWCEYYDYSDIIKVFNLPNIKKVIILPSSFYKCDMFINSINDKYIICCREQKSFEYLSAHKKNAQILLDHDLALRFKYSATNCTDNNFLVNDFNQVREIYLTLFKPYKLLLKTIDKIRNNIVYINNNKISYFLRDDKEKKPGTLSIPSNIDLSGAFGTFCLDEAYCKIITKYFLSCLSIPDIIVTDRLHVCIAACFLNKKIVFIDNSYGKNYEVFKHSLNNCENVVLSKYSEINDNIMKLSKLKSNSPENVNIDNFYEAIKKYSTLNPVTERIMWGPFIK